jgi:alpha 1,2-mannosyltransferase
MCRFNSGFFYHHELLQKYRYYWRVECVVVIPLPLVYPPDGVPGPMSNTSATSTTTPSCIWKNTTKHTVSMRTTGRNLCQTQPPWHSGFTLAMVEYVQTIPTFWDTVLEFTKENPQYIAQNNAMGFLSDTGGTSYNLCHCKCRFRFLSPRGTDDPVVWSNFEIADMNLWRGEAYAKYFDHLEASGGFYYEVTLLPCLSRSQLSLDSSLQRWGDAVVHTVAAGLFQSKDQIHFFKDIGYQHDFFSHCPAGADWTKGKCSCNPKENFGEQPPHSTMIVPLTSILRTAHQTSLVSRA